MAEFKKIVPVLKVSDMQKSVDFYTGVLGMTMLRRRDYPEGRFTLAFVGYGPEAETAVGMADAIEKAMAASEQAAPGDTTEVYRNIRVDEPSAPSEFAFKVPDGTVLKESLLEGISDLPARTSPSAAPPR